MSEILKSFIINYLKENPNGKFYIAGLGIITNKNIKDY